MREDWKPCQTCQDGGGVQSEFPLFAECVGERTGNLARPVRMVVESNLNFLFSLSVCVCVCVSVGGRTGNLARAVRMVVYSRLQSEFPLFAECVGRG